MPIFDGGRRDARRAEAASQFRQERIKSNDIHEQLELDIRTSLDTLHSAEEQMKVAEEGLTLSDPTPPRLPTGSMGAAAWLPDWDRWACWPRWSCACGAARFTVWMWSIRDWAFGAYELAHGGDTQDAPGTRRGANDLVRLANARRSSVRRDGYADGAHALSGSSV